MLLPQCIVCWINFQNISTFKYKKNMSSYTFCLILKSSKTFSVPLKVQQLVKYTTNSFDYSLIICTIACSFTILITYLVHLRTYWFIYLLTSLLTYIHISFFTYLFTYLLNYFPATEWLADSESYSDYLEVVLSCQNLIV